MSFWKIPKIWMNDTVYILGGGPSLNDTNLDLIHDRHVIGVNNAYLHGSWVDICWFGDCRWYQWHKEGLRDYPGLVVTCCTTLAGSTKRVKVVTRGDPRGIDRRPDRVSWNRNSGASAINFAYHLGAKRIVLLGYDMRRVNDRTNWHEDHPCPQKNPYPMFLKVFPEIKRDADKLGLEILNATPDSALTVFPMVDFEEVVNCETT